MLFFKLIACFYTNSRKREMCKVALVSYWYGSNTRGTTSKTWSNREGAERRKAQKKNIKARIPQRLHLKVHDSISILGDFIERQETRITNLILESSLRHKKIRIPLGKHSINKHVIIQSESWMNENFLYLHYFSSSSRRVLVLENQSYPAARITYGLVDDSWKLLSYISLLDSSWASPINLRGPK